MDYEKAYKEALERARKINSGEGVEASPDWSICEVIFPELKESDDEKIRKEIISALKHANHKGVYNKHLAWLEKQGEIDLEHYKDGENEKRKFVGYGFLKCKGDFLSFKEGETYWLEYIGNDTYIGRSDNILNQKFHITPRQLYRLFTQQHFLKEDNTNDETNGPTGYGKYVDECLNEASKHFFSEGEDKYSVADLFYAGVRCGKSWFEKQGEQKPVDVVEPKFRVGDWITDGQLTCKVLGITGKSYELHLQNDDYCHFETDIQSVNKYYHLWTIQDANDGDVLVHNGCTFIFMGIKDGIVQAIEENILESVSFGEPDKDNDYHPATKEQRDLLFEKMHEAGYEWDAAKKQLEKIIDEKQIKKMLQDNSFRRMFEQKPVWSEEDEKMFRNLYNLIYVVHDCDCDYRGKKELSDFLVSVKNRVQPQSKQEWTEEDKKCIRLSTDIIDSALRAGFCVQLDRDRCIDWFKSIKKRIGE